MKKFTYPFYLIWRHNVVFFNEIHLRKASQHWRNQVVSVKKYPNDTKNSVSTLPHKLQLEGFMHYTYLACLQHTPRLWGALGSLVQSSRVQNTLRVSWLYSWASPGFQGTQMRSHTLSCPVLFSFALYSTALPWFRSCCDSALLLVSLLWGVLCSDSSALTCSTPPSHGHCWLAWLALINSSFSLSNHVVLRSTEHRAQQHSLVCPGHFCPALPFLHDIYH